VTFIISPAAKKYPVDCHVLSLDSRLTTTVPLTLAVVLTIPGITSLIGNAYGLDMLSPFFDR